MFPKIGVKPPKSSISIGFSIINHPFWGTPIFGNTHGPIFHENYNTPREHSTSSMDYAGSGDRWYGLYNPPEGSIYLVYKRYIPGICLVYTTYHPLQEPEKSIDTPGNPRSPTMKGIPL